SGAVDEVPGRGEHLACSPPELEPLLAEQDQNALRRRIKTGEFKPERAGHVNRSCPWKAMRTRAGPSGGHALVSRVQPWGESPSGWGTYSGFVGWAKARRARRAHPKRPTAWARRAVTPSRTTTSGARAF